MRVALTVLICAFIVWLGVVYVDTFVDAPETIGVEQLDLVSSDRGVQILHLCLAECPEAEFPAEPEPPPEPEHDPSELWALPWPDPSPIFRYSVEHEQEDPTTFAWLDLRTNEVGICLRPCGEDGS